MDQLTADKFIKFLEEERTERKKDREERKKDQEALLKQLALSHEALLEQLAQNQKVVDALLKARGGEGKLKHNIHAQRTPQKPWIALLIRIPPPLHSPFYSKKT